MIQREAKFLERHRGGAPAGEAEPRCVLSAGA